MSKIDLSGSSGWQSSFASKTKKFAQGKFRTSEVTMSQDNCNFDWIIGELLVQVLEGELTLTFDNLNHHYIKGDTICLNESQKNNLKVVIEKNVEVTLLVFEE